MGRPYLADKHSGADSLSGVDISFQRSIESTTENGGCVSVEILIGAMVGMHLQDICTPALVVDLPSMERNIATMANLARQRGVSLRPYVKTHKSTVLARRQLEAGAVGIGCATLDEAEVMAASGIRDILIGNQVVGEASTARLVGLARQADIMVAVDNPDNVDGISAAAVREDVMVRVLVEVDVGTHRCGAAPGEPAVRLARHVAKARRLVFSGFMGYEAHLQPIAEPEVRAPLVSRDLGTLAATARMAQAAGLRVGVVSAGGTVTSVETAAVPGVTEIQPGTYIFMDASYRPRRPEFQCALTVLATVVSVPNEDYFIIDAGNKALSVDSGLPEVKNLAGARVVKLWEEHGKVAVAGQSRRLRVGDRIELVPSHACTTVNLYGRYFALRDGAVEAVWGISTRASGHIA